MTTVELFTHPTCHGCSEALSAFRALEKLGKITLDVTSLGTPNGRRRAESVGVTSVPTLRIDDEFRELNSEADLQRALLQFQG